MNIGGPARAVIELAKGLPHLPDSDSSDERAIRPFNVLVAAGTPPAEEGEMSDPEVPIMRFPLVRLIDPYADIRSLIALRRMLAGRARYHTHPLPSPPVDLINTHTAKAGTLGRLAALSIREKLPIDNPGRIRSIHTGITIPSNHRHPVTVHTFHGHILDGYFNRHVSKAFTLIERQLARRTDALVAISNEIRDELLSLRIGMPDQWHVIPLGLDLGQYISIPLPDIPAPSSGTDIPSSKMATPPSGETIPSLKTESKLLKDLSILPSATVLTMIARLVAIKDHSTALHAIANPILDNAHLLVVGEGELRNALERESEALGIAHRVHFLGWRQDIPDILAASDIVILTSINEGTPAALIEAAAAARPVVATNVGGVSSVVVQDKTGLLVAPKNPKLLAQAIHKLAANPSMRLSMGTAARSRATMLYNSSNFISQTAELYSQLLSRRQSGL